MPPSLPRLSSVLFRARLQVRYRWWWSASPSVWGLLTETPETAVANFFTPLSQKPKDPVSWSQRSPTEDDPPTLLVGRYFTRRTGAEAGARRKIAAFDLDSTLITTSSGRKHASSAVDWKWWRPQVPGMLRDLHQNQGYQIVILSNQAGISLHRDPASKGPKASAEKRLKDFKAKCSAILSDLDLPTSIYAATGRDMYRKPRTGMWQEVCKDYAIAEKEVDLEHSFFVGDAGGRIAQLGPDDATGAAGGSKDFSCSDRNLAYNLGIEYKTPDEFFLAEQPRPFRREFDLEEYPPGTASQAETSDPLPCLKKHEKEVVLFCGPPGAGKSTFYWHHLEPLGYERVNQDSLKSRDKCLQVAKEFIAEGKSIAVGATAALPRPRSIFFFLEFFFSAKLVPPFSSPSSHLNPPAGPHLGRLTTRTDNTNADSETRGLWVDLAKNAGLPIRCLWFKTPLSVCQHNDAVRANNRPFNPEARRELPKLAFTGFTSRYKQPRVEEGFEEVVEIPFRFRGSREDYGVWARYWI